MGTANVTMPPNYDPANDWDFDDNDDCERCGGEGWIMESDGDPSDWMEDTYCGADDSVIMCRLCKGTGVRK